MFGFPLCFYDEMARKHRLDLHLLTLGLVPSRQQAQQLIRAGRVRDGRGQLLDKPGQDVPMDLEVQVEQPPRFVSRGPRFQESCHPCFQYTRGLEDMTNASLQRGR
ncbi:Hemolysin A [Synechococcus sp. RS9917]|nr:Hemolysin A [Synechococcus sp. RS9917]